MTGRVRRACGIVAVFAGDRMELLSPATRSRIPTKPSIVTALSACAAWTEADTVPLDRAGVDYLLQTGLLVEEGTPAAAHDASLRDWEPWGEETIGYHSRARRQFIDYPVTESAGDAPIPRTEAPPLFKRYPSAPRVPLPPIVPFEAGFMDTLGRRRTWRAFSPEPMPLTQVATLLGLVFGVTGLMDAGPYGSVLLRTSPSAGARHPVEAYVCVLNVAGVPAGAYHYAARDHVLERIETAVPARAIVDQLCQECFGDAAVVCFLAAVVARSRWKYPFGRMYRTLMLDAGHIAQTFTLTATALNLASFQTAAFKDALIEDALGLDGAAEPVLHAVGAGLLPHAGATSGSVGSME